MLRVSTDITGIQTERQLDLSFDLRDLVVCYLMLLQLRNQLHTLTVQ